MGPVEGLFMGPESGQNRPRSGLGTCGWRQIRPRHPLRGGWGAGLESDRAGAGASEIWYQA
jgi:hypothetical protein